MARRLRPYEALASGEMIDPAQLADSDAPLRWSWNPAGMDPEALVPPIAWDRVLAHDRSLHYHLHSLDPIGRPLAAHSRQGDRRWIDYALPLALDWLRAHPCHESEPPFPWYDMAVGLRAYRLAYLLDVIARDESRPDEAVSRLIDGINLHMEVLADDSQYAAHSNHGLYQAAGQLAVVHRFPELDQRGRHRRQAEERLSAMIEAQFTEEGVHTEHSPGYHRLTLATFVKLIECGLIDDPGAIERVKHIEEGLAWFVQPDRKLATIGDTEAMPLPSEPFAHATSKALQLMATVGREGAAPEGRIKAFPRSGYIVFRDRWPTGPDDFGEGAHLVQMCGFHSRTHKHADDLSFTWFEHGREILIDPGRFAYRRKGELSPELARLGFMYSDPRRIYVESTRAHNTVEIDRESHDRRAKPYGSALDAWGESDDACWARSSVVFPNEVEHVRMLLFRPKRFLVVLDHLNDRSGDRHHFCQRFHAAPELNVCERSQGGVTLTGEDSKMPSLHVACLDEARFSGIVRGQPEPELLGWMSRQSGSFFPTATFGFEQDGVSQARFTTLFWWDPPDA